MDAKSIYEELLKQGIPEKLVTWSNKADSIDILIQDYNEKVYKEALKFFKGYKGVRVDYTIDHETALWCDDVSKYSSDEFIRSITDFYYTLRAKGLAYTESKKSARKSIKESTINTLDDVEFKLLDIAKNYGIAMEGSSKGLSFLNKEVSPNLIRKLNDKYYDEYSPYPPYLLAMKELLFEYDKGFSKFMDVYSKIK